MVHQQFPPELQPSFSRRFVKIYIAVFARIDADLSGRIARFQLYALFSARQGDQNGSPEVSGKAGGGKPERGCPAGA
jgi:hypothetical protein